MDEVAVDWIGSAIGGAVGAAAWAGSQLWNLGGSVVETVVDAFESLQPSPYEEWLNAPTTQSAAPTLEFRQPKNETNRQPSIAEIVTNAAFQETKTGVASPIGPEDPNEYKPLPPLPENPDPQKPLNKRFQDVPQRIPTTAPGSNVLVQIDPYGVWNPDSSPEVQLYAKFRGIGTPNFTGAWNQAVMSAVPRENLDGDTLWEAKVQIKLNGVTQQEWTWQAGQTPPNNGEFGLWSRNTAYGQTWDMFWTGLALGLHSVKRFSLAQADAPPVASNPPVETIGPLDPLPIQSSNFTPIDLNAPGQRDLSTDFGFNPLPLIPVKPDIAVPTPVNNPTVQPEIGRDGLPLKQINQIPTLPSDVHVVDGKPYNSGGIRRDIAGVAKEVGRIEGKAASVLDRVGNLPDQGFDWATLLLALQALADLFEQPLGEVSYTLTGVCEDKDENGNQPSTTITLPPEKWADRLISMGDVMPELLQAHKNFKQPTCDTSQSIPEGDFRTISFRSDETSPYGKSRLRKRLRYRSVSGNDLGAVVDHWKDFAFEGGPYRVRWIGGSWGPVEVWAASEAEGKRVIQHAAAEAGFDPFESGRWSTRVSSSARRGVQCTVRVDTTGGYYWITARDGSDQRPIVALT